MTPQIAENADDYWNTLWRYAYALTGTDPRITPLERVKPFVKQAVPMAQQVFYEGRDRDNDMRHGLGWRDWKYVLPRFVQR